MHYGAIAGSDEDAQRFEERAPVPVQILGMVHFAPHEAGKLVDKLGDTSN
jgi:hypothetical protein